MFFFFNCSEKTPHEIASSDQLEYSFEHILSYNNEDTIFIKSQFPDCGEWGGHEELIKIYRFEKKINLDYEKFKVDCGVRDSSGSIVQTKKISDKIVLSNVQQSALMKYINNLIKFKFLNSAISNSGNFFILNNTKEDLMISHYGNQPMLVSNYNDLMTALKLPKVDTER